MRKIVIAGNWKMNKNLDEVETFFNVINDTYEDRDFNHVEVIVCPSSIYLRTAKDFLFESNIMVGAQDVSEHTYGAYTGEIAANMISYLEVPFCIIGHSERRKYHNENDSLINRKLKALLDESIIPIICVGETIDQREAGLAVDTVEKQLDGIFEDHDFEGEPPFYVAYEPVWAIGTGNTASPQDAQEIHSVIRKWFEKNMSKDFADNVHILYGGSVKPSNIEEMLMQEDIDGALIGGASLDVDSFQDMVDKALNMR